MASYPEGLAQWGQKRFAPAFFWRSKVSAHKICVEVALKTCCLILALGSSRSFRYRDLLLWEGLMAALSTGFQVVGSVIRAPTTDGPSMNLLFISILSVIDARSENGWLIRPRWTNFDHPLFWFVILNWILVWSVLMTESISSWFIHRYYCIPLFIVGLTSGVDQELVFVQLVDVKNGHHLGIPPLPYLWPELIVPTPAEAWSEGLWWVKRLLFMAFCCALMIAASAAWLKSVESTER